jgi:hypothetical protein
LRIGIVVAGLLLATLVVHSAYKVHQHSRPTDGHSTPTQSPNAQRSEGRSPTVDHRTLRFRAGQKKRRRSSPLHNRAVVSRLRIASAVRQSSVNEVNGSLPVAPPPTPSYPPGRSTPAAGGNPFGYLGR